MTRNKLAVLLVGICLRVVLLALPFMPTCAPEMPGEMREEHPGEVKTEW